MTTTPPEEPQVPGSVPPVPPAPSGYAAVPPAQPAYTPPPGGYVPPAPAYGAAPAAGPISDADQRTWAMLAHLSGLLSIVATIVIWAIYKDRGQFVKEQATEALNFQIALLIVSIVGWITTAIFIGFLILAVAGIGGLILMIMAAMAANKGEAYRYPVNLRLIK